MPKRFLHRLALFAEKNYRGILVVTALLVLISLALLSRVRFDPDVLSLLPQEEPAVQVFRNTLEEFGGLDLLLVAVRVPEGQVVDPYLEFVDGLGQDFSSMSELEYVEYKLGDPTEVMRAIFPQALLYLNADERRKVEERLSPSGIQRRASELRRQLTGPQALARKELILLDPLGLSEIFLQRLSEGRGALGVDWASGYYLSRDKRLLLLLAKPTGPAQDIEFTRGLVTRLEGVIDQRLALWQERFAPQDPDVYTAPAELPPPTVGLGGRYLVALDDASIIQRDVLVNAAGSMVTVLLLFLFAFRRMGLVVYALVPLSCGLILTFGLAGAVGDRLSSVTSGCAALLVGLGIDFVIVSYGRYVEERHKGADASAALRVMTGSCGRAVVVGGITSAATFYAFSITEFNGLRQMGWLTATGILFCMVSVLLLLPAMLAWSHQRHRRRQSSPTLFVHGFGAARLVQIAIDRPRTTLILGLTATLIATAFIPRLGFESSVQNMRADGNRGVDVQREVATHFGTSFKYMMLVVSGSDVSTVLDLAGRAATGAATLVESGELNRVDSVSSLIPSPESQEQVLAWLAQARQEVVNPERVAADFEAALLGAGLQPRAFSSGINLLRRSLEVSRPIGVDDLSTFGGTERLLERYLRQVDGGWKSVVYLYQPPADKPRDPSPALEQLVADLGDGAVLTGANVMSRSLRKVVWEDAILAAVLGTFLVVLLLWLDYRHLGDALMSLVPLGVGILWMLGAMAVIGIDINFMNIFVTTMVIGIGVDYGVHMLHRYRELQAGEREHLVAGMAETGRAIAMAALTTSVGFGSLVFSHYPGLRSIGVVAILGAMTTALVAITLLPSYLILRWGRFDRS